MRLRPATSADVPLLRYWDSQPHIQQAVGPDAGQFDWAGEIPRELDWREILIGEERGRAVGVLVVIDPAREESHYWGDCEPNLRAIDIWLGNPADLGQGLGTAMMRLALDRCFANPAVTGILVDPLTANTRAQRFYRRLGFRRVERRKFGEDDCLVHRLERPAG